MTDCVSREDVLKKIYLANTSPIGSENILQELSYSISLMPSVQPERPKGEWEWEWDMFGNETSKEFCYCSNCKKGHFYDETNFCPNCGADMRGGKNE